MKIVWFFLVVSLCFLLDSAWSLKCVSNACQLPEVLAECQPYPKKCAEGFLLKPAGLCRCCKKCKRIIYENADCTPEIPIAGAISDKVVCGDGLQCINNVCKRDC